MSMNNPFHNPAFSMSALTTAINILPNQYGRLDELNLFPVKPVRTRQITVEERNGVLSLLPTQPVGSPGTVGKRGKRALRAFNVPHIPHDDVVLPEEVVGVRAFGTESELETVAGVMADHLQTMRNKHAITLEHLRIGALKGVILDADGSELANLFDIFNIAPKTFDFQLGDPKTDVRQKCIELKRYMSKSLQGERMSGIHVLVSSEFFDALTGHEKVQAAYQRWQEGAALRDDMRSDFRFAGVRFEEYTGEASDGEGNTRRFIEVGEAHAFPLGTLDTFATYVAPADFNESVNTLGQLLYSKQAPRKFDRGTDLHTQSNPLPMCHRPALLPKLKA
ncbi:MULTISPECIES: major capsid protein [Lysobacter]|uniref:major capsid protein n=1 Tax=Lysobacter TaxID=68 RepID=UPI001F38A20D|nr:MULTISPECIES: major capsid protein [Lysobacter]UJB19281.1 major capsid protein [Lysobacter capsici]UJQ26994.1 major capsid protein [Lysobacter gummosus]